MPRPNAWALSGRRPPVRTSRVRGSRAGPLQRLVGRRLGAREPEGPRPLLGEWHVDNLELQPVGAAEIDCVVAAGSERELAGSIEDLTTESTYELVHPVDLLMLLDVERHVM